LLENLLRPFWEALFPAICLVCHSYLPSQREEYSKDPTLDNLAPYFCPSCREDIQPVHFPICNRCGIPFALREDENHLCGECIEGNGYFRKARAFGLYTGTLRKAIHLLKFGKRTGLARPLGALSRLAFSRFWDKDLVDLLIPVPLHIKRLRERGFNQSFLLIKEWVREEGIACDTGILRRVRQTRPHSELSRKERISNVRGAFKLTRPEKVKDRTVILVDDVYTTGATVNECARLIKEAGAKDVDILTLARAVRG